VDVVVVVVVTTVVVVGGGPARPLLGGAVILDILVFSINSCVYALFTACLSFL
jgi:hypothetical protein